MTQSLACRLVHTQLQLQTGPISTQDLANLSNLHERTVRRCLNELLEAGYISRERAARNQPYRYTVLVDAPMLVVSLNNGGCQ